MNSKNREDSDNLFRNSINYLYNISKLNVSTPTLRCVYLTKSRLMELRTKIRLPNNLTKDTVRCQRCLLNLIDGPASYQINPEKKKSKFARKVLAKSAQNKPLTKFQLQYLKKLDKFNGNQLAVTCKFCKKETVIKLEKPKKPIVTSTHQQKIVSKKKKKKDKFCGLNQEVISLVTPQKLKKQSVPGSVALKNNNKNVSVEQYRHVTSQDVRNFDTSDFIPLETKGKKFSKFKLSKRKDEDLKKKVAGVVKKNPQKPKNNKLKNFLNNTTPKSSPSAALKNFLKSL